MMTTQSSPIVTKMKVIPAAGQDSMLLNIVLPDTPGLGNDAGPIQYLIPGWTFDRKHPVSGRH